MGKEENQIRFTVEKYSDELAQKVADLGQEWWREAIRDEKLKVNFEFYKNLYDIGLLTPMMAWMGEELVGYAMFVLSPCPFTGKHAAICNSFVLKKKARKGWNALKFLRFIKEKLDFVDDIYMDMSTKKDLSLLFERTGFKPVGQVFKYSVPKNTQKAVGGS